MHIKCRIAALQGLARFHCLQDEACAFANSSARLALPDLHREHGMAASMGQHALSETSPTHDSFTLRLMACLSS